MVFEHRTLYDLRINQFIIDYILSNIVRYVAIKRIKKYKHLISRAIRARKVFNHWIQAAVFL